MAVWLIIGISDHRRALRFALISMLIGVTGVACSLVAVEPPQGDRASQSVAPDLLWTRVGDDQGDLGGDASQAMRGVTGGAAGLVGVGLDTTSGDADAAVWTSQLGHSWRRVSQADDAFGGAEDQSMWAVASSDDRYVAVGIDASGGDEDAAVWTSPDGVTWSRVRHDEAVFGGDRNQEMRAVVASGTRFIAVGSDGSGADIDAAVWLSQDGLTWRRIARDADTFGGSGSQEILDVTLTGFGFVAVGLDQSGPDADAAVWTSTDAMTWSRVAHDESAFGGERDQIMRAVDAARPGLVAVGEDGSRGDIDAAIWVSDDGLTWKRVAHDEAVFGGDGFQSIWGVIDAGSVVVGVGVDSPDADQDAEVWTSVDGLTWARASRGVELSSPGLEAMYDLLAIGDSILAVGLVIERSDQDAAVWMASQN